MVTKGTRVAVPLRCKRVGGEGQDGGRTRMRERMCGRCGGGRLTEAGYPWHPDTHRHIPQEMREEQRKIEKEKE
ncbi:hypothetical protein E2C01_087457 [Portunus trituberculatus]|uniref:Uncharacterized protein n=1 Tax=Portunus trituberculatus TaxID=210409 RepID=A0A5B7J3E0_PORTR|nr:hypothetical protein [Portunus trituberculatus]